MPTLSSVYLWEAHAWSNVPVYIFICFTCEWIDSVYAKSSNKWKWARILEKIENYLISISDTVYIL